MVTGNGGRLEEVMEEAPLKRVGRYDLLEVIGRGGAAVVYLARQSDLQRYVALKELAPFHAADETFAQRFVEEGRLAGAMNHANIVTVHEFFEHGGVPYIAMEYLPHGSLRQYIDKLSLGQVAGVIEGVLAGLSHGGVQHVVHRDLKPENLLVAVDGRVKIADFGVARAYNNAATRNVVTVTGTTIGTPAYMSPEQALGSDLTPACDLYSLGVIAWELFAGHTPFGQTETPVAVLYRHVHEGIPRVSTVAPEIDPRVDAWVSRLLEKDAGERPQSADEAWYELEDIVLDLLGPRWRRDARLAVDHTPTVERAPLAPAPFTDSGPVTPEPLPASGDRDRDGDRNRDADGDAPPQEDRHRPGKLAARRRDTEEPLPAVQETSGAMATAAPSSKPRPSYTTIMRPARRHRDAPDEQSSGPDHRRRRLIALGVVLAMAAAAVGGVLAAGGSGGPAGPTPAQQRAAQHGQATQQAQRVTAQHKAVVADANAQLVTVIDKLAPKRSRDVTRLGNTHSQSGQVQAATTVQSDYLGAADKVALFAGQTPLAKPLATTLHRVAADYGRLAAAAKAQDTPNFAAAKKAVTADEIALKKQVLKL
jgi:serine/threonine protein kinase